MDDIWLYLKVPTSFSDILVSYGTVDGSAMAG